MRGAQAIVHVRKCSEALCRCHQTSRVAKCLQEVKPNLIVEVGVWKGQSASYLAGKAWHQARLSFIWRHLPISWHAGWLKQQNKGLFVAVDTWLGNAVRKVRLQLKKFAITTMLLSCQERLSTGLHSTKS